MRASSILDLPASPAGHFKLYFFATVFHVIEQAAVSFNSADALLEQFPFLSGYLEEIPLPPDRPDTFWPDTVREFERRASGHLPLRALREATGLDHRAITLLLAVGLIEEDGRFGALFDAIQDVTTLHRPTLGLLNAWWREPVDGGEVRAGIRRLRELGLVHVINPEAPRIEWALHAPSLLWDALRGETPETPAPWLRYRAPAEFAADRALILPDSLRPSLARLPALLASGDARVLLLRGPRHNGRRTVLGSVARALGRGMLEVMGVSRPDDERWKAIGPLATLLHAMPAILLEPSAGETIELPGFAGYAGPLGIVLGKQGGVSGRGGEGALTLSLPMPEPAARRRHWEAGLDGHPCTALEAITDRFRMTSGNIRRAAVLARSYAALRGEEAIAIADVQQASRTLNRQALDTLASRLEATGSFDHLAVDTETLRELRNVEARCRHRERLHTRVGDALQGQVNVGVRALFQGPSGTGKTLAAKLLAAELGMDLYRVELSSVVSKYIGETEKNLSQIFALAEELDIILLFDEGDSLLSQRTAVQTSNDRYANLETNYLLQRIESFEGILIVTTNAGEHIDNAFARRMDVVVDFHAPEASERWEIWKLHLPADHAVGDDLLHALSARCTLTGGQVRNAVLHAALLALNEGCAMGSTHIEAAVQREYRKIGGVYPLRRRAQGSGV